MIASEPNDRFLTFSAFEVDRKYWPHLREALTPSRYDPEPDTWPLLCHLQITDDEGHAYRLTIFYVDGEEDGAYSLFSSRYDREDYYRGGNSRQFLDALVAAGEGEVVEQTGEDEGE